jgi:hypothetical protein
LLSSAFGLHLGDLPGYRPKGIDEAIVARESLRSPITNPQYRQFDALQSLFACHFRFLPRIA